jgi:hypothetical protein
MLTCWRRVKVPQSSGDGRWSRKWMMSTRGRESGGVDSKRLCSGVCRNALEVPMKKTRGLLCGNRHKQLLCSTTSMRQPVGSAGNISSKNQSAKLRVSPLRRLRMPDTFSSTHQVKEPWWAKCRIHMATVTKTLARASISMSRFPMLLNGGHGGPETG